MHTVNGEPLKRIIKSHSCLAAMIHDVTQSLGQYYDNKDHVSYKIMTMEKTLHTTSNTFKICVATKDNKNFVEYEVVVNAVNSNDPSNLDCYVT